MLVVFPSVHNCICDTIWVKLTLPYEIIGSIWLLLCFMHRYEESLTYIINQGCPAALSLIAMWHPITLHFPAQNTSHLFFFLALFLFLFLVSLSFFLPFFFPSLFLLFFSAIFNLSYFFVLALLLLPLCSFFFPMLWATTIGSLFQASFSLLTSLLLCKLCTIRTGSIMDHHPLPWSAFLLF